MAPKLKMWIPVILAICWSLYLNEWSREIVYKLIEGDFSGAYLLYEGEKVKQKDTRLNEATEKLFSREELAKFNNIDDGLYLSILGQVFDVSKGKEYYEKGSTYHAFTGRDASMAFLTGDFTEAGLTDDISSLKNSEAASLHNWLKTYHEKYIYKGKLIGRFYDENGKPKKDLLVFEGKVKEAQKEQSAEEVLNKKFPPCNVEWSKEQGTRYWCSSLSGGISRDWTGVPRQFLENPSSQQRRCACVNLESLDYLHGKANFREYEDCASDATTCIVKS
ncbi:neuferricin [Chelonus insularis]|uniref:neuferricin n=1 Tax=Chelonus insularis TaxID=460826 RepID=UPI00158EC42A|nr:neuferricin [Chelonus insularis]